MERRGEKIGVLVGMLCGILWLLFFSVIWIFKGLYLTGLFGLVIFMGAVTVIMKNRPWKKPEVYFYRLFLPYYAFLYGGLILVLLAYWRELTFFNILSTLLWTIPVLLPILLHGKKTWNSLNR